MGWMVAMATKNPIRAVREFIRSAPQPRSLLLSRTQAATRQLSSGSTKPSNSLDLNVPNSSTPAPGTIIIRDVY